MLQIENQTERYVGGKYTLVPPVVHGILQLPKAFVLCTRQTEHLVVFFSLRWDLISQLHP